MTASRGNTRRATRGDPLATCMLGRGERKRKGRAKGEAWLRGFGAVVGSPRQHSVKAVRLLALEDWR
jgi:hypothetical protein